MAEMADLAKQVVERSIAVPGVQPKLSLTFVKDTLAAGEHNRLTVVGALGGHYIFKPPSPFYPEMPENEHLTMVMANLFRISTVPCSLIRMKSGELSYLTKRIDRRDDGSKIHMLDMFQLLEAVDKYKSSNEKIGKAIDQFCGNVLLEKTYYFDIVLFSFLTGNNDMHLKNFSLIHDSEDWRLAPAYDLLNVTIANPDDKEEIALTLEGKKKKLNWSHFERLATGLGMNAMQIKMVFNRFANSRALAFDLIDQSFLSSEMKAAYKEVMDERYKRLEM